MPPEDCGASAPAPPLQLVVFVGDQTSVHDLPVSGEVTIGRAEENIVCIDDPSVSRRHAVLRVGEKLEIEDLSGANGIFLRDKSSANSGPNTLNVRQLLRRKAHLSIGERIVLGTASIILRRAPMLDLPDLALASSKGSRVVVRDPAMRALYEHAVRAARAPISVLLLGETGVGKEVLARAIHAHSTRVNGPFMGINCAALAETLLESELFGNEKGAFTGAIGRRGLFEAASGGTVFLDEIGELPLVTQGKLLRVLEERVVVRLGSSRERAIDVRFVAATNRNIESDSRNGRFRADLYFRINGISLTIPPLRERAAELEKLVGSFITGACRALERADPPTLSVEAFELMRSYPWPGNVRELRNVIDRAVVLCAGEVILPEHLPSVVRSTPDTTNDAEASGALGSFANDSPQPNAPQPGRQNLLSEIKSLERARIVEAIERCAGNQSKAAELLGISRGTLVSRLAQFGLPRPRKPPQDVGP